MNDINEQFILRHGTRRRVTEQDTFDKLYSRRLVHANPYSEHHEFDLGDGYTMQVHFLLAQ